MNRAQKSAWFGLAISILLLVFFVPHVIFATPGSLLIKLLWLSPAFGFFILLIFLFQIKSQDKVSFDERDRYINRKALIIAFSSTVALLIGACMVGLFTSEPISSIPILLLPALLYTLFVAFIMAYSVAILGRYGWRNKGEKS
jgi:hypothetical protein